jgi:hypothetical protein
MRIQTAIPEDEVSKPVLDASLEAVTRLNESLIRAGKIPTFREAVDRVRWKPEPPGQEHFDHGGIVLARGWGDCDDLGPWHAASLRVTGEDRGARSVVHRSGPKTWHAVVERTNTATRLDDPSKEAGMPSRVNGCGPSCAPVIPTAANVGAFIALPRLALRANRENPASSNIESWQARADLPWNWSPSNSPTDVAMASLHMSPVASQRVAGPGAAIVGALDGAIQLARASGYVSGDTINVGAAMQWVCSGAAYPDVAREFGPEIASVAFQHVGSLFSKITKKAKKVIKSKPVKFAAPLINPAGYALAKGALAATKKGGLGTKVKAFGGGYAQGYTDRLSNPAFKAAASAFGMKGVATAAEKATRSATKALSKGGSVRDVTNIFKHGASALAKSKVPAVKIKAVAPKLALPKVKVPAVKIKAVAPKVALPKGAIRPLGLISLKSGAVCDPSRAVCFYPGK